MNSHPTFDTVQLPEGIRFTAEAAALQDAARDAHDSGRPVAVSMVERYTRSRFTRVVLPDGRSFDVRGTRDGLTVDRLTAAARQSALRGDQVAAMAAAFAVEHLTPTPEEVAVLERFVQLAADAARCDHDHRCCKTHGTHSSPHVGCILR